MHFDTALNVVWSMLGILACAGAVRATRRYDGLRIAGAALLVAALLFPFISATDDVLRIEHFRGQSSHTTQSHSNANENLIRLYQTMDTPLVCAVVRVFFVLSFVLLVAVPVSRRIDRSAPFESGRSPPGLVAASV